MQLLAECVLMLESKHYKFSLILVCVYSFFRLLQVKRESPVMISLLDMFTGVWKLWERNFLCILIRKLWGKKWEKGFLCIQTECIWGVILFLLMALSEIWKCYRETSHQPLCSTGLLDTVTCSDNLLLYSKIPCTGIWKGQLLSDVLCFK